MNILVIGLGSIALKHIQAIRTVFKDVEISALRSNNTNTGDVAGVKNIFSFEDIVDKPDFILISNPTNKHYDTIEKCIEIGCPLMIEKPVLQNTEGYEKLLDKINQKNILTYVACNLRFHPVLIFLRKYVQARKRAINEVNIYCGSYLPDWRPNRNFREIYSANAEMGGGVHLDLIHEIDYCLWIFGNPIKSDSIKRNKSSLAITAVDYAHYDLEYSTFFATVTLNYYRKDAKRRIEILFEDGTWLIDLIKGEITDEKGERIFKEDFNMLNTYTNQLLYFVDCINKNTQPMNNFEEAIKTLRVCTE